MKKLLIVLLALAFASTASAGLFTGSGSWTYGSYNQQVLTGNGGGFYNNGGYGMALLGTSNVFYTQDGTDLQTIYMANPINVSLVIEGFAVQSFAHMNYDFHVIPDVNGAKNYYFVLNMVTSSNLALNVGFQQVPAGLTNGNQTKPVTWYENHGQLADPYNHGSGDFSMIPAFDINNPGTVVPNNNGNIWVTNVQPCDRWYQFVGCFNVTYHEAPGTWDMTFYGCPVPAT